MTYKPTGVCAKSIEIDVQNGIINTVSFTGGCNGNLQGISNLVQGMGMKEAVEKLRGIKCGFKNTSCPDQLACALQAMLDSNA